MPQIVVTGATGAIGGRVARGLAAAGHRQRLVVRDPSRAPRLEGVELAQASYDRPDQLRAAFAGARTLCFVSAAEAADRVAQHRLVVQAAAEAGVRHVVYTSFLGASPDATFTLARDHFHTEQAIVATGMAHTFLRDNLYIDFLPDLVHDGEIRGPAGTGRVAAVARDDVAAVAVAVLLGDGLHEGRTYDLTGPVALSLHEVATELSRRTGRPIAYLDESLEEAYASRAHFGAAPWEVAGWVTSYSAVAAGDLATVSPDVERIIGRPPISPAAWLDQHPESYVHLLR